MSYITLGNMRRFLNKLKDYLSSNYLKLTGGTVTGKVNFERMMSTRLLDLTQNTPILTVANSNQGDLTLVTDNKYAHVLDSDNYNKYAPKLDGTGATGTWPINISGNALNDSNGNKIVDTYAKKSDIPTVSNITVDSALSATSTNPVQNKVIKAALTDITSNTVYATYVTAVNGLTIPGGKIWIA